MITVISLIAIIGITWACGLRAAVLLLALPILGLAFGGFCWALASMIWPSLLTAQTFAAFTAIATVAAGVLTLRD